MSTNTDQARYWNSEAGQKWAAHQLRLDTLMSGVLEAIVTRAAPQAGEHVLDIGCGTGASALRLSQLVGQAGQVTALDISAPLLDMARARTKTAQHGNLTFVQGDAQTYPFGGAADLVFLRFGVMFFDDPVAAMANLRRATRPGGRLAVICWQGAPENPWFMLPMQEAVTRLGKPEPMDPHAPGPMAFKDIARVTGILHDAGWAEPKGEKLEVDLIPPQTLDAAADFATTIGPATRLIRERDATEADVAAIRQGCKAAFAPYQTDAGLRFPARLIAYTAVNGGR